MGDEKKEMEHKERDEEKRNHASCFLLISPSIVFSTQWKRRRWRLEEEEKGE